MNAYRTITAPTEGIFKEKGSKFLAFAYPLSSENEAREKIEFLRKQFHDARHHCYAYMLGLKEQQWRANDDGEPGHSAGDPILGQIRSRGLTNCLVVVVRYFGGTKLGVGGLINAYKTAAEDALEKGKVITIYSKTRFNLKFPYPMTAEVERILNAFEIEYVEKSYTTDCKYTAYIKDEEVALLTEKLELFVGVSLELLYQPEA